jgi:hypothetical protein
MTISNYIWRSAKRVDMQFVNVNVYINLTNI